MSFDWKKVQLHDCFRLLPGTVAWKLENCTIYQSARLVVNLSLIAIQFLTAWDGASGEIGFADIQLKALTKPSFVFAVHHWFNKTRDYQVHFWVSKYNSLILLGPTIVVYHYQWSYFGDVNIIELVAIYNAITRYTLIFRRETRGTRIDQRLSSNLQTFMIYPVEHFQTGHFRHWDIGLNTTCRLIE